MGLAEIIFPTDSVTSAKGHFNNAAQKHLAKPCGLASLKANSMFFKENRINQIFSIGNLFNLYSTVPTENILETLQKKLEPK